MTTKIKYSDVLIEAKKHLSKTPRGRGRETNYVCFAVESAAEKLRVPKIGSDLRCRIMNVLQKEDSFALTARLWLIRKGIPKEELTPEAMQDYRHRWLDHLIEQFKEAGE